MPDLARLSFTYIIILAHVSFNIRSYKHCFCDVCVSFGAFYVFIVSATSHHAYIINTDRVIY
jgi:hypothetical protein